MIVIRDFLFSLYEMISQIVAYFAEKTDEAGIVTHPLILLLIVLFFTLWLGSGAWAASIAGVRAHRMLPHFFIGMAIPYLYPFVLMFALDVKGAKDRTGQMEAEKRKKAEVIEEKERVARLLASKSPEEVEDSEEEEFEAPVSFDAAYFQKIYRDEDGELTGPWLITYGGDTVIRARRILQVLPETIVAEIDDGSGDVQRLRVRYERIDSVEKP